GNGQPHFEGCPLPRRAMHSESTLVSANDAPYGRQTQSTAGELCGKEGIEDSRFDFLIHSAAGILYFERDVLAILHLIEKSGSVSQISSVDVLNSGAHRHRAGIAANRFSSVDDQIHNQLL